MLVAFWRWWKLLQQHLSTKDNERNLCQDLLTIENTGSDLKVHALHYANELLKNFCKLAKQTEAITNYQKQVWLWLGIVWETLKLTRYQSKQGFFFHSLQNKGKSLRVQLVLADTVHSRREIVFDPEKLSLIFH